MEFVQKKKIANLLEKMESEVANSIQICVPCVDQDEKQNPGYVM